ncbi:hypothetical protein B0A78_08615 [Flavobacterium columnare NBRC 100251 = ATCC 23463]|uniref:hypothetical protein n=1 Tax=Flavobacterium columnare TaxID=996 RepID=UPI000BE94B46|nr:hypothetical protein [Flavobacterium columnare]PDS23669.1 hypothetical protein B0A78_08615 [Flavobacterium columnare NBRC 100251 = ATCC 23463]GEM59273.1 hypothetical protein FC1_25110 [Flavobacterium columnare NBRC 100251 = ATCC 23463]
MKKTLLIAPLLIISCGKEVPKCESFEVKQTVMDIIKEQRLNSLSMFEDSTKVMERMDSTMVLNNIRTENINEEIQKCECEASLEGFPYTMEDLNELSKAGIDLFEMKKYSPESINIKYNAQINANGEIIVEVEPFGLLD